MRLLCCFFFFFSQVDSDTSGSALDLRPASITLSLLLFLHKGQLNKQRGVSVRPRLCLKDPLKRAKDFLFFAQFSLYSIPHIHTSRQSQCVMRRQQLQTRVK